MSIDPAARLLHNISASDLKSFAEFHQLFYEKLISCVSSYIKSKEDAEEIVSDIFVGIWLNREQLVRVQKPESYLLITARNKSLNYLKSVTVLRHLPAKEEMILEGPLLINANCPGKELEKKELEKKIESAIKALPMQCRTVFLMIREQQMKYREVAEALKISQRTVETQLSRAQKKLRNAIEAYHVI